MTQATATSSSACAHNGPAYICKPGSGHHLLRAVQVGLPLIVHERFLAAYDFIPRNAVAVSGAEGDAGAMHTLLALSASQLEAKLMNVSAPP